MLCQYPVPQKRLHRRGASSSTRENGDWPERRFPRFPHGPHRDRKKSQSDYRQVIGWSGWYSFYCRPIVEEQLPVQGSWFSLGKPAQPLSLLAVPTDSRALSGTPAASPLVEVRLAKASTDNFPERIIEHARLGEFRLATGFTTLRIFLRGELLQHLGARCVTLTMVVQFNGSC